MITFQISAPGRIILCGEHTVMYGKQVVAASLDIRTTLKFRQLPLESGIIEIRFPDVDISLDIPLQMIVDFTSRQYYDLMIENYTQFLENVRYFITLIGLWKTHKERFSLQIFFFLLFAIARKEVLDIQPFHVSLTTELEMNAGLGSSTSFATCLAACFLHWSCLQKGDHSEFTSEELGRILAYVMSSEEDIQNYVLNQDHMVCTHGRVTAYRCREPLDAQREIINTPEIYIFLVDANIRLDKRQQMKQLADKKYRDGIAANVLLDEINNISEKAVQILRRIGIMAQRTNTNLQSLERLYEDLQAFVTRNQEELHALHLSNQHLNHILQIAHDNGDYVGKLTGTGEKRFAFIVLAPGVSETEIEYVSAHIQSHDYPVRLTSIGCDGVRIH